MSGYQFTFLIHGIKDPDAASRKAKDFFESQGVSAADGKFKGSGWEGRTGIKIYFDGRCDVQLAPEMVHK